MKLIILNFLFEIFIKIYNFICSIIKPYAMWDIFPFMHRLLMWEGWKACDKHPTHKPYFKDIIKDIENNLNLKPKNKESI